MTIYNINLGIGWASSGVEYAQAYRATLFRKLGITAKFIFTDFITGENIQHLTQNMGFKDDEVIWLYSFFTDIPITATSVTLADVKTGLIYPIQREERLGKVVRYFNDDMDFFMTCYCNDETSHLVQRVEYVSRGILIRKDYFTSTRLFSEYYAPKDGKATVYLRRFFNQDGSVAYEENVDGVESIFRFKQAIYDDKSQLLREMLARLQLSKNDLLILDRSTGIGQTIFQERGAAKLAVVIHAEHFSPQSVTKDTILWNNFYEYQFTNADKVDAFICATAGQSQLLAEQFKTYQACEPRIVTIAVGSLPACSYPQKARKPFSLVTASRLAPEKHVDWLIKAVIKAKQLLPELSLDIYGTGGEEAKLRELIQKHQAQDYIRLLGHKQMAERYQAYEVYLAGSTSEGFGLTLMEAVGSGLALIGLDVRYGNQTFIKDGQNGYLIPRKEPDDSKVMVEAFAKKILDLYTKADLTAFSQKSYQIASSFLEAAVMQDWHDFLKEVVGND
ncbi:accessory Sec system glycosyltransferase GtfA [Streptococcus halichoeri]|uniref:accessory Sec system glycosyltransferase GtfA n=1 Tax=Streptococcus halichoeri TaxID=254785 RepID=UPI00135BF7B8|nr:accessory Sec system glycosyltransferase GtfA [Streptococcus halichoeri]